MRAFFLFVLCLSSACATVLRGPNRDVNIYGPENLAAYEGGQQIELRPVERTGDQMHYVASVNRHTERLTLRSPQRAADAELSTHVVAGWVILDFLLIWPISLTTDLVTGAWKDFDDLGFAARGPSTASLPPLPAPPPRPAPVASAPQSAPAPSRQGALVVDKGKLAVLDFQNFARDLTTEDVRYFADVVRGAVLRAAPHLEVMTRENLLVLLQATGKDASNCEGECEVDTGRRIGADAVVSGEVLKVGSRFKISLKLHETRDGRLLSTSVAQGKSIDELDDKLQEAATELIQPR